MQYAKTKSTGFEERYKVQLSLYPPTKQVLEHVLFTYSRKQVKKDDVLDALELHGHSSDQHSVFERPAKGF